MFAYGYPEGTKGYKLWCTELAPPKSVVSRDVIFNENAMMDYSQKNSCKLSTASYAQLE